MIKLSVIIVNYNVRYFLEQCLQSVVAASTHINIEIFVVDNNSTDDSVEMVKQKFKQVILIESKVNLGFSKGNNLALKNAKGQYVLLLNPDTVVQENTFDIVVNFFDKNPLVGGVGVKMIDGKGKFLPESKRGLPTPLVAFYKIFGLSQLFPKSKTFGKYHLGFLNVNSNNEIEVLSGAFMAIKKEVLDKIGFLDEAFFMYGEDIDLSYRISQAGFKNYYLADTTIIHYKGESTKKSSINYVFVFYRAMVIFAKKHFSKQNAQLFSVLINLAIYLRAGAAVVSRIVSKLIVPFIDFSVIILLLYVFQHVYSNITHIVFPQNVTHWALIIIPLLWVIINFFSGSYDKPYRLAPVWRANLYAAVSILILYSLLPENFRFSRAVVLVVLMLGVIFTPIVKMALSKIIGHPFKLLVYKKKRTAIVGSSEEIDRVKNLLNESNQEFDNLFYVSPTTNRQLGFGFCANINQLNEASKIFKFDEIIFCSANITAQEIIKTMQQLSFLNLEFKIAPSNASYIIGSNSINTTGQYYSLLSNNNILTIQNLRNKKMFDVIFSLLVVVLFPLFFVLNGFKFIVFKNAFLILAGKLSWVGYDLTGTNNNKLPKIKQGVLSPSTIVENKNLKLQEIENLNFNYAKNYNLFRDLQIVFRSLDLLGQKLRN